MKKLARQQHEENRSSEMFHLLQLQTVIEDLGLATPAISVHGMRLELGQQGVGDSCRRRARSSARTTWTLRGEFMAGYGNVGEGEDR